MRFLLKLPNIATPVYKSSTVVTKTEFSHKVFIVT